MNNEMKPEGQGTSEPGRGPETGAGQHTQTAQQQPGQPGPSTDGPAAPTLSDAAGHAVLEKLVAENAELKDKLLRAQAEMDNIRKRTEREKSEAHKYAVTKFARDVVTVGDNFQRAIESVPAQAAEQSAALKSFLEGVTMTERELINTLERHGIKRIDPKGQPFNPHHHQAVSEMHNTEVPNGTVTQVFQCGYLIEDRVLRPAMVVVAKGGAKAGPKAVENGGEQVSQPEPPTQAANDDTPPRSQDSGQTT